FKELNQKINSKEIINKKDKKIKLIFAGRLTHQKGIDLLLDQISKIKTIDFELLILGIGELENQLLIKIKDLKLEKKVKMLGYQKNPYIYFSQSDIFILPSRIEGFPNVAIESLALGIPIIANDFKGGINEIIIDKFNGKIINFELENNFEKIICDTLNFRKNKKEIIADTYFKY
ncbi:MAG: glycosyltransferase, partial [Cetobacterium sp.]